MTHEALDAGLAAYGLELDAPQHARLRDYVTLIAKWNKVYNLTAIRDPQRMLTEHLLDSLAVLPHVRPRRVLDVGSGAGLPGIPIAIARPELEVTVLDSNRKKAAFLTQAAIELELDNVRVICERVERLSVGAGFDTVISRAFAGTQQFARVAIAQLAQRGVMLAMKGLYPDEELAQLPVGVVLEAVVPLRVPGLDAARNLVLMTKA